MKRLNFTLDAQTTALLHTLAAQLCAGNQSLTIRVALQSLAREVVPSGWILAGCIPEVVTSAPSSRCHACGRPCDDGSVVYRPVYRKGTGPGALPALPTESWFACLLCAGREQGRAEAEGMRAMAPGTNGRTTWR